MQNLNLDEKHFAILDGASVEIYSKEDFLPTPMPVSAVAVDGYALCDFKKTLVEMSEADGKLSQKETCDFLYKYMETIGLI